VPEKAPRNGVPERTPKNDIPERTPKNDIPEKAPRKDVPERAPRNGMPKRAPRNGISEGAPRTVFQKGLLKAVYQKGLPMLPWRASSFTSCPPARPATDEPPFGSVIPSYSVEWRIEAMSHSDGPPALWCSNHISLCTCKRRQGTVSLGPILVVLPT
jgi:hypothetical protein